MFASPNVYDVIQDTDIPTQESKNNRKKVWDQGAQNSLPDGAKILANRGLGFCLRRASVYGLLYSCADIIADPASDKAAKDAAIDSLSKFQEAADALHGNGEKHRAQGRYKGLYLPNFDKNYHKIINLIDGVKTGQISLLEIAKLQTDDYKDLSWGQVYDLNTALVSLFCYISDKQMYIDGGFADLEQKIVVLEDDNFVQLKLVVEGNDLQKIIRQEDDDLQKLMEQELKIIIEEKFEKALFGGILSVILQKTLQVLRLKQPPQQLIEQNQQSNKDDNDDFLSFGGNRPFLSMQELNIIETPEQKDARYQEWLQAPEKKNGHLDMRVLQTASSPIDTAYFAEYFGDNVKFIGYGDNYKNGTFLNNVHIQSYAEWCVKNSELSENQNSELSENQKTVSDYIKHIEKQQDSKKQILIHTWLTEGHACPLLLSHQVKRVRDDFLKAKGTTADSIIKKLDHGFKQENSVEMSKFEFYQASQQSYLQQQQQQSNQQIEQLQQQQIQQQEFQENNQFSEKSQNEFQSNIENQSKNSQQSSIPNIEIGSTAKRQIQQQFKEQEIDPLQKNLLYDFNTAGETSQQYNITYQNNLNDQQYHQDIISPANSQENLEQNNSKNQEKSIKNNGNNQVEISYNDIINSHYISLLSQCCNSISSQYAAPLPSQKSEPNPQKQPTKPQLLQDPLLYVIKFIITGAIAVAIMAATKVLCQRYIGNGGVMPRLPRLPNVRLPNLSRLIK